MIKTLNTPTGGCASYARLQSVFVQDEGVWLPRDVSPGKGYGRKKKEKKKKTLAFLLLLLFLFFFLFEIPSFFLNIRVFAICMQTPNTNGEKKKKRKEWFQSKKH